MGLRNWGFQELEEAEYKESVDEMKDADQLVNRILFLEGLPNLQNLHRLRIGENVQELLRGDLELEMASRTDLLEAISTCERARDFASRELLTEILEGEEKHIDWIETQLDLIEKVGLERLPGSNIKCQHTGEYYGVAGQTIAGIASFGSVMLVRTGFALSLHRFSA